MVKDAIDDLRVFLRTGDTGFLIRVHSTCEEIGAVLTGQGTVHQLN